MTTAPIPTPNQAYNIARALEQKKHQYTTSEATEGAECACGVRDPKLLIGNHIEYLSERAGVAARDAAVLVLAAQHIAQSE